MPGEGVKEEAWRNHPNISSRTQILSLGPEVSTGPIRLLLGFLLISASSLPYLLPHLPSVWLCPGISFDSVVPWLA